MSDLASQTPANTYKGLLQVNDYTNGVDAAAKFVQDGEGTDSALAISTTAVGIGTTSPGSKLAVFDSSAAVFRLETPGVIAISHSFDGTDYTINNNDGSSGHPIIFGTKTAGAESMRIDSAGNVGIGTTSPDHKLEVKTPGGKYALSVVDDTASEQHLGGLFVNDNGATTDGLDLYLKQPGASTKVRIASTPDRDHYFNNGGNVGIGTASPSAVLHLDGDSSNLGGLLLGHAVGSGIDSLRLYIDANNKAHITRGTSEKLTIDSTGNVGIGTTNPQDKLQVYHTMRLHFSDSEYMRVGMVSTTASSWGIQVNDNDGTDNLLLNPDGGNVGIGTTSPSAPLEVSSTTGGVIMPRMTTTEMNAISSPTDGEMIYNTTTNKFYGRASGSWVALH